MHHRSFLRLAGGLLGLAILAAVPGNAIAQCAFGAQEFANIGGGPIPDKVRIDPNGAENSGNELGRFWQSDNSLLGNNFGGFCESDDRNTSFGPWWQFSMPPLRGLRGAISGIGCVANSCPEFEMTFLVEERGLDPAEAFFIAFRVDETPGADGNSGNRWWDLSRVDPNPSPSILPMLPFPVPEIVASSSTGLTVDLDLRFPDVAANVHAVNDPDNNVPLPASSIVQAFDLYLASGFGDPGREIDAWTLIDSDTYQNADGEASITVVCPEGNEELRLALGITFEGGVGPGVASELVGRSIVVPCGQATADAGTDLVAECAGAEGTPVTLDGSGSTNAATYLWEAPGIVFDDPTSSSPTGSFPTGTTTVTLTVTNGRSPETDTDMVSVTVVDMTPPEIVCSVQPVTLETSVPSGWPDDEDEDVDDESADDEDDDGGSGGDCPGDSGGDDPGEGDLLTIGLDGSDSCGDATIAAVIELGWGRIDVQDGTTVNVLCLPESATDCGTGNACGGNLQVRSRVALLVGTVTDQAGNTATCTVDLCSGNKAPAVRVETELADPGNGSLMQLFERDATTSDTIRQDDAQPADRRAIDRAIRGAGDARRR